MYEGLWWIYIHTYIHIQPEGAACRYPWISPYISVDRIWRYPRIYMAISPYISGDIYTYISTTRPHTERCVYVYPTRGRRFASTCPFASMYLPLSEPIKNTRIYMHIYIYIYIYIDLEHIHTFRLCIYIEHMSIYIHLHINRTYNINRTYIGVP
jgi:hypothetical protein